MATVDLAEAMASFWAFFARRAPEYESMLRMRNFAQDSAERLLQDFQDSLGAYHASLGFRMGGEGPFELIITAEGDARFFEAADRLVASAPAVDNWKITALVPRRDLTGFSYQMDDVRIDEQDVYFGSREDGLALYVVDAKYRDDHGFKLSILRIAEAGVGERTFAAIRESTVVLPLALAREGGPGSVKPIVEISELDRR